jgi:hypothetical protein
MNSPYFDFNIDRIQSYFEGKDSSGAYQIVSEQVCLDLDFNRFFETIDFTSSCIGQQYLYDHLRCISSEPEAWILKDTIAELKNNPQLVAGCKKSLAKLSQYDAYSICSLFQENHPVQSRIKLFIYKVLQFLPLLFLSLFILSSKPIWISLAGLFFLTNFILHYKNKETLLMYIHSIPQYLKFNAVARKLSDKEELLPVNPAIKSQLESIRPLNRQLSFFRFDTKVEGDFAALIWLIQEFIRIFFLFEPNILYRSFRLLQEKKKEIERIFSFVGCVDMLISIGELQQALPYFCEPQPDAAFLSAKEVYHPLIESCVPNSIETNGESVLLTGSNMSGKTTFIRTIGLNLLCAQTLNLCFAKEFSSPLMKIHTAIHLSDSLEESLSFYMKEVVTIKEMLTAARNGSRNLFLLDELYKGTNTLERIAAGKAVLSALAVNGNLVFASTHDLELAGLLAGEYRMYHFCEQINRDELSFDYQLKNGQLNQRNAIRLLEIQGYPPEVVAEAYNIVAKGSN